ncbi:uncharacterized protein LOC131659246 [Vicia villosa]|uniref:uncharacterized protein LOC131659246 n=1 Tax=Vicia villosa TaxID=3911 RepID=UPI00273BE35A|nr:uncharacterized protein LOC131659246 [Vicia villosa]
MGMRLEEGIQEGCLVKEAGSSLFGGGTKRFCRDFSKKKEETKNLVQLRDPPPPLANPSFWYKADAHCAFHKNAPGHTVENYYPLMSEFQKMIRSGMLAFKDVNPNVQVNPLPNHGTVNAIQTQATYEYIHDICESTQSLVNMHAVLCELNYFPPHDYDACPICSNTIRGCTLVVEDLQKLLGRGIISITRKKKNEEAHSVNMVHGCPGRYQVWDIRFIREPLVLMHVRLCRLAFFQHNHAVCEVCYENPRDYRQVRREIHKMLDERTLHITYERDEDNNINVVTAEFPVPEVVEISYDSQNMAVIPLTIQMPKPFPYNSSTTVPWRYGATTIIEKEEYEIGPEPAIVNIADMIHMTQSGRLFAPVLPKPRSNLLVQVTPQKDVPRKEPVITEPVFETKDDDMEEFLNLIKKSDYKVVEQLLQTQSKISLLSLLVHSKVHQNALMKVLKQAYIEQDATLEQFDNVVSNITVNNVLSFSKEELPSEGLEHNHALHISMKYGEDTLTNVLVDIGSSLNVMLRSTLERLSYQGATIRLNGIVVKAFDGSKCSVIGEIDLPIRIGPRDFEITFQIMDIYPAYSCLLVRPWIHNAGAVTSTLHQMLKFAVRDKLIAVYGEQTILSLYKPVENNDPRPPPNFEYPVYEAEEESSEEIPEEISRLLEHEKKIIDPHKEPLEVINLGTEEEKREKKIRVLLEAGTKKKMVELLKEYVDVFGWSYQDMPELDTNIVEHRLPLK